MHIKHPHADIHTAALQVTQCTRHLPWRNVNRFAQIKINARKMARCIHCAKTHWNGAIGETNKAFVARNLLFKGVSCFMVVLIFYLANQIQNPAKSPMRSAKTSYSRASMAFAGTETKGQTSLLRLGKFRRKRPFNL